MQDTLIDRQQSLAPEVSPQQQVCVNRYWEANIYARDNCKRNLYQESQLQPEPEEDEELPHNLQHLNCDNFEEELKIIQEEHER